MLPTFDIRLAHLLVGCAIALALACGGDAAAPADGADATDAGFDSADDADSDGGVDSNTDTDAGCVAGELGCECAAESTCNTGECVAGICEDCVAGGLGCACDDEGHCEVGNLCGGDDLCVECLGGEPGCPCAAPDDCEGGLSCINTMCTDAECTPGTELCPCDDGACDADLGCHVDDFCYACNADAPGCECDVDNGCANDLICDGDDPTCRAAATCGDLSCAANQLCGEGLAGEDATCLESCTEGYVWSSGTAACLELATCSQSGDDSILAACTSANRTCVATGSTAACGDCLTGFVDAGESCRAAVRCQDLGCSDLGRGCTPAGHHTDAACEGCELPFAENPETLQCEVSDEATCSTEPGDELSLLPYCTALSRVCDDSIGSAPSCGDCLGGFAPLPGGNACAPEVLCSDLSCELLGRSCDGGPFAECGDCQFGTVPSDPADPRSVCLENPTCDQLDCGDQFCIPGEDGATATCEPNTCEPGEVIDPSDDTCITCSRTCGDGSGGSANGETGRVWLHAASDSGGGCICETETGYYVDPAAAFLTRPCDKDGDGWVRVTARGRDQHPDAAIRDNWRCNVTTIDRVTLENEFGQRLDVLLCEDEEPVPVFSGETCTLAPAPLSLFESVLLDDNAEVVEETAFLPAYRRKGTGRQLRAEELNPMTRACVNDFGDFNANGMADVREAQQMIPTVSLEPDELVFLSFGYFLELHRGSFEQRIGQIYDTYVISERPRCGARPDDAPFALDYTADDSQYWRECTRNRHADYDARNPRPGFDFAQFSCDATSGTCSDLPLTTDATPIDSIPSHGLCDVPNVPAEGWLGMSHHSQFRCVQVVGTAIGTNQLQVSDFFDADGNAAAIHQFNECWVDCPEGDLDCAGDCTGAQCATSSVTPEGDQPVAPVMTCNGEATPEVGDFGFAALGYTAVPSLDGPDSTDDPPYAYEAGCIDEWEVWPDLCPGYRHNPFGTAGDGELDNFGGLVCGCSAAFGGVGCQIGCTAAQYDPELVFAPRQGTWMCGELQASHMTTFDADAGAWVFGVPDETVGPAFTADHDGANYVLSGAVRAAGVERAPLTGSHGESDVVVY